MIWARMRTFPALKKEKQPSFEREGEPTQLWERRKNNTMEREEGKQHTSERQNNPAFREIV